MAGLNRHANNIYEAMMSANADGFKIAIVHGELVDLYDPRADTRTPLPGAIVLEGR